MSACFVDRLCAGAFQACPGELLPGVPQRILTGLIFDLASSAEQHDPAVGELGGDDRADNGERTGRSIGHFVLLSSKQHIPRDRAGDTREKATLLGKERDADTAFAT
jgi:hypothetical protein